MTSALRFSRPIFITRTRNLTGPWRSRSNSSSNNSTYLFVAIHVALKHVTRYSYDRPVAHGAHVVRLRPAPHCRTRILSYSQRITGGEHFINWQQDPFANWNARLVFPEPMTELCVEVELVAEMAVHNPFDFFIDDSAQVYPFVYETTLKKELAPFMELPAPT